MADIKNSVSSGTAGGAVHYLENLMARGYVAAGAVSPLKIAFVKVMKTVNREGWESVDLGRVDADEYMVRFANMTSGSYKSQSLIDYKSRFRKVLDWYAKSLAEPGWMPESRVGKDGFRRKKEGKNVRPALKKVSQAPLQTKEGPGQGARSSTSDLVAFPFPLSTGVLAMLHLPSTLREKDAKRMARFIDALVVEGSGHE